LEFLVGNGVYVWSGLVWSGLVWSGLVWSGLVWSGKIRARSMVIYYLKKHFHNRKLFAVLINFFLRYSGVNQSSLIQSIIPLTQVKCQAVFSQAGSTKKAQGLFLNLAL
jgi:hypothetical protein